MVSRSGHCIRTLIWPSPHARVFGHTTDQIRHMVTLHAQMESVTVIKALPMISSGVELENRIM